MMVSVMLVLSGGAAGQRAGQLMAARPTWWPVAGR